MLPWLCSFAASSSVQSHILLEVLMSTLTRAFEATVQLWQQLPLQHEGCSLTDPF